MKIPFLFLAATAASACGAESLPAHIVQDLPPELDPRLAPPFEAPAHIVRDINAAETAEREAAMVPLDRTRLDSDFMRAAEEFAAREKKADADMQSFFIEAKVAAPSAKPNAPAVGSGAGQTAPESQAESLRVTCADGMYFDEDQGVFVFLRDVKLRDPSLSLDCDNQLKIFLARDDRKKKSEPRKDQKNAPELAKVDFNFNFSQPRLVTADGNVVIKRKDKKGDMMEARGDKLSYDGITGEIIMTGDKLYLSQGNLSGDVTGPGAFIRIYKDGHVYVKGRRNVINATGLKALQEKKK